MTASDQPADQLPTADWNQVQEVVARFEEAWRNGRRPAIDDYWPTAGVPRLGLLVELAHTDLECRLKSGEAARVETYLARYPELAADCQAALGLISAEYQLRRRQDPGVTVAEYLGRFSGHGPEIAHWASAQTAAESYAVPNTLLVTMARDESSPQAGPLTPAPAGGGQGEGAPKPALPRVQGYEILEELGRGGMGVVYKARCLALKRTVALKMLLASEFAGPVGLARFRTEAEAVASLQHPHIVQIYELGEEGGRPFLALEYLEGGNLEARRGGAPLQPREAARLVETLARAMQAAHEKGVVHRDLKPANVLLTADGSPKVADFGLARQAGSELTSDGEVMGTPSYMAPEQAQGLTAQVGPATDVYALGAMLYDLLTGRPPFRAPTAAMTLQLVLRDEPVSPRRLQSQTPRDLETICLKCLHKAPARRYPTAQALAEDLERFLAGRPILARPTGPVARLAKWVRREPAAAACIGAVVLLALSLLGWVAYAWRGAEAGRAAEAQQRRQAAEQLYLFRVALADRDLSAGKPDWACSMWLDLCPEELRGWEWRYLRRRIRGEGVQVLEGSEGEVSCLAASPDGASLASASGDGFVRLWDAATGRLDQTLAGHTGSVNWVAFSGDGKSLVSAGEDGWVFIWDRKTGQILKKWQASTVPLACVAFHPDGQEIAVSTFGGDEAGVVRIWRIDDEKEIHKLTGHTLAVTGLAYSPDGATLATASHDRTVRLWDSRAGEQRLKFEEHHFPVAAVAFHPDGRMLASAAGLPQAKRADDEEVLVWSAETGQVEHRLQGHAGRPLAVAFSPDGGRLATAGFDHEVKLWDVASGLELLSLKGHQEPVMAVAFGGGGRYLVSGSLDHTVRIWDGGP